MKKNVISKSYVVTVSVVVTIIISILTLVVSAASLGYALATYNQRYDADAKSASTIIYNFDSNKSTLDGEAIACRGMFYYGLYQSQGNLNNRYSIEYKRANSSRFKYFDNYVVKKNLTGNEKNDKKKWGKILISKKYFFRVSKLNNNSVPSIFNLDWFIE